MDLKKETEKIENFLKNQSPEEFMEMLVRNGYRPQYAESEEEQLYRRWERLHSMLYFLTNYFGKENLEDLIDADEVTDERSAFIEDLALFQEEFSDLKKDSLEFYSKLKLRKEK
jgi:hypothetical protein